MNYLYTSLGTTGTVQASAADAVVASHQLTITGAPVIDTRQIESFNIVTSVAETLQVTTITPTFVASADYSILLTQQIAPGQIKQVVLSYTTPAGTVTPTAICDALRAQLAAFGNQIKITGSGTSTLILTAQTGTPIFTYAQVSNSATSGTLSFAATTAGVAAVGTYAALVAQGITTNPALVSGQAYTQLRIQYKSGSVADVGGDVSTARTFLTVLINNAATNYAALATRLGEIKLGYGAGVTTADPASIALTGGTAV